MNYAILVLITITCLLLNKETATASDNNSNPKQLRCLALNIYWEGRSESRSGRLAIAHVTLNRVDDPAFPNTICEVVHDGGEVPRGRCQFSWWCDGMNDTPKDADAWEDALDIAREVAVLNAPDPTNGALFFHHRSVSPHWSAKLGEVFRIGDHIFYK